MTPISAASFNINLLATKLAIIIAVLVRISTGGNRAEDNF